MNKRVLILTDESIEHDSNKIKSNATSSKLLFLISSMQNKFPISVITTSENIENYISANIHDVKNISNIDYQKGLRGVINENEYKDLLKTIYNADIFISFIPDIKSVLIKHLINIIPSHVDKYVSNAFRRSEIYKKRNFKIINKSNYNSILEINIKLENKYKNY